MGLARSYIPLVDRAAVYRQLEQRRNWRQCHAIPLVVGLYEFGLGADFSLGRRRRSLCVRDQVIVQNYQMCKKVQVAAGNKGSHAAAGATPYQVQLFAACKVMR